jgi:hypothetical protein
MCWPVGRAPLVIPVTTPGRPSPGPQAVQGQSGGRRTSVSRCWRQASRSRSRPGKGDDHLLSERHPIIRTSGDGGYFGRIVGGGGNRPPDMSVAGRARTCRALRACVPGANRATLGGRDITRARCAMVCCFAGRRREACADQTRPRRCARLGGSAHRCGPGRLNTWRRSWRLSATRGSRAYVQHSRCRARQASRSVEAC